MIPSRLTRVDTELATRSVWHPVVSITALSIRFFIILKLALLILYLHFAICFVFHSNQLLCDLAKIFVF